VGQGQNPRTEDSYVHSSASNGLHELPQSSCHRDANVKLQAIKHSPAGNSPDDHSRSSLLSQRVPVCCQFDTHGYSRLTPGDTHIYFPSKFWARHKRRSRSPICHTMPLPPSPRHRHPSSHPPSPPPPRRRRYDSRSPPHGYWENRRPPRRSPLLSSCWRGSPSPYSRPVSRSLSRSPRYRFHADWDRACSPTPQKRSLSPAYHSDRASSHLCSPSPREYTPSPHDRGGSPTRLSRSRSRSPSDTHIYSPSKFWVICIPFDNLFNRFEVIQ
jgi:hypothetical protein